MRCNKLCRYFNLEQGVCSALSQVSDLLPCEIERRERRRETMRKSQKKRRAIAVENGKCVICATRQARSGKRTCSECSKRISERSKMNKKQYSSEK